MRTSPQSSVMRRERRRTEWAPSSSLLQSAGKSRTLEAASEFSEPLALDMATARMAASSRPASPTGISRTRKSGRMLSGRAPGARSGVCRVKAKSSTPINKKTANWTKTMMPLASSALRLSDSLRAASRRWTMVWSVPWLAMVRKAPPITPDQKVYFADQANEKSSHCNLWPEAAAMAVNSRQPPGILCSNSAKVRALPVR